ncbi:type II secretion system protein D (GspD) [Paucimonas lemoignei]|uniref:Type II secretion system protein D (GspD) n=1 Tax=Paucimonas lemoignei TaxID=29443 RepID=A0A4R3HWW0_PAULE|nr:type II secretion system secretin GspD [Paucimonas lemoignei]TCS37787.1 type II secretion system protein D (GspD) [Paucimonas lemoignei]
MKIKPSKTFQAGKNLCRSGVVAALMCALALPPAYAQQQEPAKGEAVLNFVGADIESVVKAVGHYTNMTFLIDPRVKGTISLISERPVSKSEAFSLLSSALRLQGYTVVIGDGFAKVVPEADAKLQAGPIQAGAATRARGDQIATQIFRLNYESAANLVTVLRPLISPNNTINANPGNNSLVITDYADNLKRMGKIIAALDSPASGDMDVVPVRHAIASDIATMVNRLMEPSAGAPGGADRISLLADSRTNSVIVRAPSAARANLAKSLIAKLDQPTSNPGNVHVVYLKNADATKLAQTLRAVVSADASSLNTNQQGSGLSQSQQGAFGQQGGLGQQGSTGTTSGAGLQSGPLGSGSSTQQAGLQSGSGSAGFIQADPSTNTLIITASEAVYRNLRAVIDKLDARRAQVYVESLIVEVNADNAGDFGVQWLGLSGDSDSRYRVGGVSALNQGGTNIVNLATSLANLGSAEAGVPSIAPGLSLGLFRQINGQLGLGAVLHALRSVSDTNILSTPNLLTLDNEEARIIVGQNVPFITGQYTTAASGGAAGVNPFQTVERRDIGLSLRVKPQVSEGGTIKLGIYQESSDIDSSVSSTAGIITTKRSIETNVLVDDGQIIVLGGLISDTTRDGTDKVPGLGDIPIIGNLFKAQSRQRTKRNLMVFLRPVIIRTAEQNASVVADRYDYIRGAQMTATPRQSLVLPNTGGPMLPPLENGRPVGGTMLQQALPLQPAAVNGTQPASVPAGSMPPSSVQPSTQTVPQPAAVPEPGK